MRPGNSRVLLPVPVLGQPMEVILMLVLGGSAKFVAEPRDEPAKRGSILRNRRDEPHLRGCWFRGAARRNKKGHF